MAVAMVLLAFTFGATIAWRLETRRPLVLPLWLAISRGLSFLALAAFIVVSTDPPSRIFTIDPLWWNVMEALIVMAAVATFGLEIRHALLRRGPA